jgi:hypothetical protein
MITFIVSNRFCGLVHAIEQYISGIVTHRYVDAERLPTDRYSILLLVSGSTFRNWPHGRLRWRWENRKEIITIDLHGNCSQSRPATIFRRQDSAAVLVGY